MGKRSYDREFKVEAIKLASNNGRSVREVAAGLGIHDNLLYKWRRDYLNNPESSFLPDAEREEFKKLKRRLKAVTEERDILKKALAIFSKTPQ